jgi:hypothetical protein
MVCPSLAIDIASLQTPQTTGGSKKLPGTCCLFRHELGVDDSNTVQGDKVELLKSRRCLNRLEGSRLAKA